MTAPVSVPSQPRELTRALLLAQRQAQAVTKASTNSFHNYKYASGEDIILEARECLLDNGIVVSELGWEARGPENTRASGYDIAVRFRVAHAESGEELIETTTVPVVPEKGRPVDKAQAAALTLGLAYFLRGLLLIPRSDTDEKKHAVDQRDDRGHDPKKVRPASSWEPEAELERAMCDARDLAELKVVSDKLAAAAPPPDAKARLAKVWQARAQKLGWKPSTAPSTTPAAPVTPPPAEVPVATSSVATPAAPVTAPAPPPAPTTPPPATRPAIDAKKLPF